MDRTSFFTPSSGIVTVSTPFSIPALIWSTLASSGSLNLLEKLPLLRSIRCQVLIFSSCSLFLCSLIWRILPYSISTFSSSFSRPGTLALNACTVGVSFQSTSAWAKDDISEGKPERGWEGHHSRGSQTCSENGSKVFDRRPNKLGINDMVVDSRRKSKMQRKWEEGNDWGFRVGSGSKQSTER